MTTSSVAVVIVVSTGLVIFGREHQDGGPA